MADCNTIKDRIRQVRDDMKKCGISVYVVTTGDYHISEYAGEYFMEREYISGFTGSAGTIVISLDFAALFTDGRYFVQAQRQILGTGIQLMRSGTAGVPEIYEYCGSILHAGDVLGFDGRTMSARMGICMEEAAVKKGASVRFDYNAVAKIYKDRAPFPNSKAFYLDERYSGRDILSKLSDVRHVMKEHGADCHVLATLDDIGWLFNIRGRDIACNPVIMAYACIFEDMAYLYTGAGIGNEIRAKLEEASVQIRPYEQIYEDVKNMSCQCVLLDEERVNIRLMKAVQSGGCTCVTAPNPEIILKAVKNSTEVDNLRAVHIDDGVALTKFIFWVKKQMSMGKALTEADAAKYLDNLRGEIHDFIEPSFDTISAYNENAAMMHYKAEEKNCAKLMPYGMLLVDSGGQYLRGTTDVTRTIALGLVTDEMKKYYTLTLKGMLNLANAHFLEGCTGQNLDILARAPLWELGIDYRCGTGHGVGYLLNVHEAPNAFRWKCNPHKNNMAELSEGMVTSDEPGVYMEGKFGIRIENEILCVKDTENEYGTWLKFETLTKVPVDLELVDISLLNEVDRQQLNDYHKAVYDSLCPYFSGEELQTLRNSTRAV